MEIRDYQPGDEKDITELFNLVFKQEMSLVHWNWRFTDNPAGKHFIKLMWDGEQLAGHYAVSPVWMKINEEKILSAQSLTTMTHPDYGGRGIFKTLAIELYRMLEEDRDVKMIWGYPNNNSHYGFIKNLGWENVGIIHTLSTDAKNFIESTDECFDELQSFPEYHAQLLQRKNTDFPVSIEKSVEYLNWRFVQKPSVHYRIFEHKENKAVIVSKLYPSPKKGFYILNIIELGFEDISILPEFLSFVIASYKEKIDQITLWKNLDDQDHIQLERIGFVPSLPQTYLGFRASGDINSIAKDLRNWNYSMGDSDVF